MAEKVEVVYHRGSEIRCVRGALKSSGLFGNSFVTLSGKGLEEKDEEGDWKPVQGEKIKELAIGCKHVIALTILDEWMSEED